MTIKKAMSCDDYELLGDSYDGTGKFLDGSALTKYIFEEDEDYTTRKKLSFYLNYVKVVVDSHVKAIFDKEAVRQYSENIYFGKFVDDCDAMQTNFNRWMKRTAQSAKLFGSVLVVVDNFQDQPENVKAALDNRVFPYVYTVNTDRVSDYKQDAIGRLMSMTYTEDGMDVDGKPEKQYRRWDTKSCVLFAIRDEKEIPISSVEHNLGILPCFFLYGFDNPRTNVLPVSEFIQVARTNLAIFNLCSEIRELQRKQGFNVLAMPGTPQENKKKLGAGRMLYYPAESSNSPAFIAPDASPMDMLYKFIDRLVEEIYRMSCVTYTQQYATTQSGESKKWTFQITKQILNDFALNCQQAEEQIGVIFSAYIKSNIELSVVYDRKYGVEDIDGDLLRADTIINKIGLGAEGDMEVRKDVARKYFAESPDEDIQRIEDAIEKDALAKEQNANADELLAEAQAAMNADAAAQPAGAANG